MAISLEQFSKSAIHTDNIGEYLKGMDCDGMKGIVYPSRCGTYYVYIGKENNSYFLELLNDVYYSKELEPLEKRLLAFVNEDL
jgi:hypothetical protein